MREVYTLITIELSQNHTNTLFSLDSAHSRLKLWLIKHVYDVLGQVAGHSELVNIKEVRAYICILIIMQRVYVTTLGKHRDT